MMPTDKQIKDRVLNEFFNNFTYKKDDTYFTWRPQDTPQRVLQYILTLVDGMTESNQTLKK